MTERSATNPPSSKINNVQALRAFAALAVVVYHTGYVLPGAHPAGFFGVDVFFLISGYIMARICDKNPSIFLRRRIIRIVPPYWTLTILLFLFAIKFPSLLSSTRPNPVQLIKSLLFIPFFKSPGVVQPILFLGWTLNYEMFFYVAVALGLLGLRRFPLLFASCFLLLVALGCRYLGQGTATSQFFSNGIIVEFPLGALAYTLVKAVPRNLADRLRLLSALLVASSALLLTYVQAAGFHWRGPDWTLTAVTSFVLLSAAVLLSKAGWDTQWAWVVLAGDSSYILYLIHPYCIFLIGRILARTLPWLNITHFLGSLLASLVALGVAIVLHLKVELPVVASLNQRFGGHRQSVEFKPST